MGFIIGLCFCLLVGWWASSRGRSFWGFFILSIVLSPLLTAILVLIFKKYPKKNNIKESVT